MPPDFFSVKNSLFHIPYKYILKKIFFLQDPENVHDLLTDIGKFLGQYQTTKWLTKKCFFYGHEALEQTLLDIHFKNPIGLAAGFDKNAQLTDILPSVGFGFLEIGSVTGEPCAGNPKPRLWRLPKSKSLVVYYGLKNDGCEVISERLKNKTFEVPIGINVAKTNSPDTVDTQKGIRDYIKAYTAFRDIGAYDTINISCPNAFGGEPFTEPIKLELLLQALIPVRSKKPIFLKISPDISKENIDAIIDLCEKYNIDGFICTNLTKKKEKIQDDFVYEKGGMSGKILGNTSDEIISYIYKKTKGKFVIVGLGGIFTAKDAYQKIRLGASLLQMITGMIYEGPQVIGGINHDLVRLLQKDGFKNISEAVGVDIK